MKQHKRFQIYFDKSLEKSLTEFNNCPNGMFRLVKGLRICNKKVYGGRRIRGSDIKLCFYEKERGNLWNDYMLRIMN